ncbi:hypothetical protein ACFRI7_04250 [Streptomyces sp. NPDC056716]|uniref:hypothetical protein n=1 Tax=unclassified Streptomyces TaxID=2593676 RepID=UPI00367A6652
MSGENSEIDRIDGEIKAIKNTLNGDTNKESMEKRLGALEEKDYVLGHEFNAYKNEAVGAVSDFKMAAFEVAAAKIAWDIISLQIPPIIKLNEEFILHRFRLTYNNDGETGGLFQRLVRDHRDEPTAATTANTGTGTATTTTNTATTNTGAATVANTRAATAGAQQVTNETNRLTAASGQLQARLDG